MNYCIHSPKYKLMHTKDCSIITPYFLIIRRNLRCDRDENVSLLPDKSHLETPQKELCTAPTSSLHIAVYRLCRQSLGHSLSARLFLLHWSPIYGPKYGMLDISVNKTKEDLSRPLFPIVYQGEVLKRQLTFSLAFPICSILVPASPLCLFIICSHFLLAPLPNPTFSSSHLSLGTLVVWFYP